MLITVGFGVLGLLIGSFINAVVWRLHERSIFKDKGDKQATLNERRETSISRGHSMCPHCRHRLVSLDLVPVVSWVMLRGRCRYCRKPISAQYPLVELLTAGLFVLSYRLLLSGNFSLLERVELVFWLYFLVTLIILAVYDLRWYILPDAVLLPAILVAMFRLVILAVLSQSLLPVSSPIFAALAAGGSFYAVAWLSGGRWMGGGDIKLAFLMGLILGLGKTALAMLLAFNVAAAIGVMLIALKLKTRRDHIPFGPFLAAATVMAVLYGQPLIAWYLKQSGI